ncbi:hypothetical protein KCP75_14470 [Salmonella enterica subsp. enterica]|nr:hypothetical protein KCP75_14470 [Salmonella enterica subsp. enterica]
MRNRCPRLPASAHHPRRSVNFDRLSSEPPEKATTTGFRGALGINIAL